MRDSTLEKGLFWLEYWLLEGEGPPKSRLHGQVVVTWVIQGSLGTPSRTPGGPDLDFYRFLEDFETLLGPCLESIW